MELNKKAAYLQGLVDGLGVDESTKEGKIIKAMAALLGEMADARKNGHRVEELTAWLEAAAATLKERRAKLRELERKLLRKEDE